MNEETNRREQNALREKSDKQEVELAANESAQSEHTLAANDAATKIDAVAPTELTNTPTEHTALHKEIILPNADKQNTAHLLGEVRRVSPAMSEREVQQVVNRQSRRTFLIGGASALGAYGGWRWLHAQPSADGIPAPFRASHEFNEQIAKSYFSSSRLAPEFNRTGAREPRINGGEGLSEGFDPATWRLQVTGVHDAQKYEQYRADISYLTAVNNANAGDESSQLHAESDAKSAPNTPPNVTADRAAPQMREDGLLLTLEDIKRLPRVEMTTQLKCIEGWSQIVHWAGARFADFARAFLPQTRNMNQPDVQTHPADLVRYVSLVTPDGGYYVGMDMASALHPQTLLCYEMNGAPLTLEHGAPLRLVTPVKYGIKYIKRIGRITYTDKRPADFWAERGYDWYSGH